MCIVSTSYPIMVNSMNSIAITISITYLLLVCSSKVLARDLPWFLIVKNNQSINNWDALYIDFGFKSLCFQGTILSIQNGELKPNCIDIEINDDFKCTDEALLLGPYMTRVCSQGACSIMNGTITTLNLNYLININETIILNCNMLDKCNNKLAFYTSRCLPLWMVIVGNIFVIILILFVVILPLILLIKWLQKWRLEVESTKNRSNSRVKYQRGKATIIPNSRAPNRTKTSIKKNYLLFCCFISLIQLVEPCDSIFDYSSEVELCKTLINCKKTWFSEVSFSSIGQTICFKGDNSVLTKITLLGIKQDCVSEVEYFTPIYDANLDTYIRCSGTSECSNGIFSSNSTQLHIDLPKQNRGRDFCLSPWDECLRVTLNIRSKDNYCSCLRCTKIQFQYKIKIEGESSHIINLKEGSNDNHIGFQIKAIMQTPYLGVRSYLDCGSFFYTKESNSRNTFDPHKYGLIQCPTAKSAQEVDMKKCSVSLNADLIFQGYNPIFIDSDKIEPSLKLPKSTSIRDLLNIKENMIVRLQITTNTQPSIYVDDLISDISNITVFGEYGIANGSQIKYLCKSEHFTMLLNCNPYFTTILFCSQIGWNNLGISLSFIKPSPKYNCDLSSAIATKKVQVSLTVSEPTITIYGEDIILAHEDLSNSEFFMKYGMSLSLDFLTQFYKYYTPVVILLILLILKKIVS